VISKNVEPRDPELAPSPRRCTHKTS